MQYAISYCNIQGCTNSKVVPTEDCNVYRILRTVCLIESFTSWVHSTSILWPLRAIFIISEPFPKRKTNWTKRHNQICHGDTIIIFYRSWLFLFFFSIFAIFFYFSNWRFPHIDLPTRLGLDYWLTICFRGVSHLTYSGFALYCVLHAALLVLVCSNNNIINSLFHTI